MKTQTKRKIWRRNNIRKRKNKTKKGGTNNNPTKSFNTLIDEQNTNEMSNVINYADNSETFIYASSVAVTTLAASGVGLPVSGILAGLIVACSVFMRYLVINHRLFIIIFDVMQITLKGYLLYDLIKFSFDKFENNVNFRVNHTVPSCTENRSGNCIKLDEEIKKAIFIKICDLFTLLLSIMPQEGFEIVKQKLENKTQDQIEESADVTRQLASDIKQINTALGTQSKENSEENVHFSKVIKEIITTEDNARKKNKSFRIMKRMYSRFADSKEVRTQIISYSTIINGYFMILNTQYQFSLDYFKAINITEYDKVMNDIHTSNEFLNYLVPPEISTSKLSDDQESSDSSTAPKDKASKTQWSLYSNSK
jgi:hypothetical protein